MSVYCIHMVYLDWPLVEALFGHVALHALVLYDELHALEEGGGDGGRVLPQQNVDWLRHSVAELAPLADWALAALGIFTVSQSIWKRAKNYVYF